MESVVFGSGKHALRLSKIGLGCMSLTAFYGKPLPEDQGVEVLKGAYNAGYRHFDTAQVYAAKDDAGNMLYNEALLGKFLKEIDRNSVTVATKFFPRTDDNGNYKWSKELFMKETENSLQRLGVNCIDLYYFHRIYPESVVSIEECMKCMKELVDMGKVKCVGLSEASPSTIRRAHKVLPVTAIQQEWSLFAQDLETEVVPTCKELGIGIVSYSPVARGFLTGMINSSSESPKDWRATIPYMSEENIEENLRLLQKIKDIAKKKDCTVAQLCIAWVVAQGAVPIPGSTKVKHIEENAKSATISLSSQEVEELRQLGKGVKGPRGSESYMKMSFHSNA